jgi:hypothetical protein
MLTLDLEACDCTASPRVASVCVCELSLVYAGRVVCRERVRDEESKCGLYDEDLRVGAE